MVKTERKGYQFIFGPVPSRRLGLSLGVDIMPHKTCSLDCVYCECGKTTRLTIDREVYTPIEEIKQELSDYLKHLPELDYITFSGSGEPTLHLGLAEIIAHVRNNFPAYKIALLTNSTLFFNAQVRQDVANIDLIIASIDAASGDNFVIINRPHPKLEISRVNDGIVALRKSFKNELWIEFFVVPGVNDGPNELKRIDEYLARIGPERVQINTLDRPGTEDWVKPANENDLKRITAQLKQAETINNLHAACKHVIENVSIREHFIATLKRRPCTVEDIKKILGISAQEADTLILNQLKEGTIEKSHKSRGTFFKLKKIT